MPAPPTRAPCPPAWPPCGRPCADAAAPTLRPRAAAPEAQRQTLRRLLPLRGALLRRDGLREVLQRQRPCRCRSGAGCPGPCDLKARVLPTGEGSASIASGKFVTAAVVVGTSCWLDTRPSGESTGLRVLCAGLA